MKEKVVDLGLWLVDNLTLASSINVSMSRYKIAERRFFLTHDYQKQLERYGGIDKIFLVNSIKSVFDIDARKTKEIAQQSLKMQQLKSVYAEERDIAIYALDYLIKSDKRSMFNFNIPVDNSVRMFGETPKLREKWIATLPAPFGQVVNCEGWVVFYRSINNFFWEHLKEISNEKALLGFFCKKCDSHYEPKDISYQIEKGHRGPVEMKHCPKGHYV